MSAHAATYTVSSPADAGPGTLRQAILDANGSAGADQIVFTTPAVVATAAMPDITDVVAIDGSVGSGRVDIQGVPVNAGAFVFQAGASGSTLTAVSVRLYLDPLTINANNVTVTDSVFENVSQVNGTGNTLNGGNVFAVLRVFGSNNIVEANAIGYVAVVNGANNRIGSIGNGNTIGPGGVSVPVPANFYSVGVISAGHTFIEGNEIASNSDNGVYLADSSGPGATISGNTIHGQNIGILVSSLGVPGRFYGARILGNSIYDVNIPIDLGELAVPSTGPTANDPAPDADDGGNHLQNYPAIASAIGTPTVLAVNGVLVSAPLTTYRIELFGNPATSAQARTSLGTFDVTTDAAGNAPFTQLVAAPAAPNNVGLTATATNLTSNETSEVSAPVAIEVHTGVASVPTASTWALIGLALGLAAIALLRT
ncbi:MAG TPA: right-handed parallel beta-helix repeat-containing protein [Thermoanaerobaculia bacterium]